MNPKVDFFFNKAKAWQEELRLLRSIILDTGLSEELKWGVPCYTYQKSNIVLIHAFKEYCAVLFHNGVLLNDSAGILIQQTENVQSARQIRFASVKQVSELEATLKAYIFEAIEVEEAGLKVEFKTTKEFAMPEELQQQLDADPDFKAAFEALTPGRQRGYLLHFGQPKQSKTRVARIEKFKPKIFEGKGWNDREKT